MFIRKLTAVLALLTGLAVPPIAAGQQVSGSKSPWFIGIDAGTGIRTKMGHSETFAADDCSAAEACEPQPGGMWDYSAGAGSGWSLAAMGGYQWRMVRLELSAARQSSVLNQSFVNIKVNKSPTANPPLLYGNAFVGKQGQLNTMRAVLSVFYVSTAGKATGFAGGGLGLSRTRVTDVLYDSPDSCIPGVACYEPITRHVVSGRPKLQELGLSQHLSAGVEYDIGSQVLMGIKFTYSRFSKVRQTILYETRPDIGFADATISGIRDIAVVLTLRYAFGL